MKKQSKILTLTLVLALIISAVVAVGIVASAEDSAPALPTIKGKNLYYEANTSIAVQVEYEGTLASDASLGIIVWDAKDYDGNPENAIHKSFKAEALNGAEFYLTQPIEAGNMSYPYVIAAAIKNSDGTYTVGEAQECSVVKYAYQKLGEKTTVLSSARICDALIKYAEAADNVITNTADKATFGYIKAVGGTVSGYYNVGGINGKSVVIRADAVNAEGKYFQGWTLNGETVSGERVITVTVPEDADGAVEYVATYGDEGQGFVVNLDGVNPGSFTNISGYLTVSGGSTSKLVKQDAAGVKYLIVEETKGKSGSAITSFADDANKYTEASVDFSYADRTQFGSTYQIITASGYINDSTTAIDLRFNVYSNKSAGGIALYIDNRNIITGTQGYITGTPKYIPLIAGQYMTFTAKVNVETDSLDLYFDGEYYGSAPFADFLINAEETAQGYETKRTEIANALNVATYTATDTNGHRNYFIYDADGNFVYKDGSCTFKSVKTVFTSTGTTETTTTYKYENGTLTQVGDAVTETLEKTGNDTLYTCEMVEVESYGTPGDVTSFTFSSISISAFSATVDDSIFYKANFN